MITELETDIPDSYTPEKIQLTYITLNAKDTFEAADETELVTERVTTRIKDLIGLPRMEAWQLVYRLTHAGIIQPVFP